MYRLEHKEEGEQYGFVGWKSYQGGINGKQIVKYIFLSSISPSTPD